MDFRNRLLPKNYVQFDGVTYRQLFEERTGFLPNLSILDLLFCEGKKANELLYNGPL
ncbi:MAG: WbqC family protein [Bacteroidota bacterium]